MTSVLRDAAGAVTPTARRFTCDTAAASSSGAWSRTVAVGRTSRVPPPSYTGRFFGKNARELA